jgi:S-methyl-5-thioribose-1-phosphate isomerase
MSQSEASRNLLESIKYRGVDQPFELLDQRLLPHTLKFDVVESVEDTFDAIKEMRVRGAPAIAVTAALGVAVAAHKQPAFVDLAAAKAFLVASLDRVAQSRPTAVNLFNAVRALKALVDASAAAEGATAASLVEAFKVEAERMLQEDVDFNTNIMKHGAKHLLELTGRDKLNIVTICNTGALATARFGTALGVVRELHYTGHLEQIYALETRPWNQGARLTVFECVHEKMPVTLLVDNALSSLMRSRRIDAVIVGADRVCQNGDTANKIGTYNAAVAAKHHGVPFFVAAPTTTLDKLTADGSHVEIEERTTGEITHSGTGGTGTRIVVEGETLKVWNPVFDITPAELITGGIITEKGVATPAASAPYFDIASIVAQP